MIESEHLKLLIDAWIKGLRSGNGDYKKVYVEDMLSLYKLLGISNPADNQLLDDLVKLKEKYK